MNTDPNDPTLGDPTTATTPGMPAPEVPAQDDGAQPMFDKPNLQLRDPDPYAFANRIRKLILLASVLACVAVAPFLSRMFAYQIRRGQMQAEVEIATDALGDIAPQLRSFEEASRLIARKVGPSVVSIKSYQEERSPGRRRAQREGQGSGFIIDPEGYVVTNFHVIKNSDRVLVYLNSGKSSDATVVGADPATDLAILKIDGDGLPALEWGDSDALQMGDLVWAVGSPFGLENSITFGIVSAKARSRISSRDSPYQEYVQSDAAVNPGNSGGPLVNLSGRVIGVNTAIVGESYQGVSLSIPSNFAKEKYAQLRENKFIERGFLGITPFEPTEMVRERLALDDGQGVLVMNVQGNTPAASAGLRNGDVILKWNDYQATNPTLLSREIAKTEIGSTANVLVRRLVDEAPIDRQLKVRVGRRVEGDPR